MTFIRKLGLPVLCQLQFNQSFLQIMLHCIAIAFGETVHRVYIVF